jgi:acyl-CoA thioesterase-1
MSTEPIRWLLKVLQPESTLGSMPGIAALDDTTRAALLGIDPDAYRAELAGMRGGVKAAAEELLADPEVAAIMDRLPLQKGARVVAFGDSHTADPQAWAAIVAAMLATRRPDVSLAIRAVPGETTTHALVRIGEVIAGRPDWLLVFFGINDARTQGPRPTKTLVDVGETARNLAELKSRFASETSARVLWIAPAAVIEERVAAHWGLSRFGVRFRNEDVARVAHAVREQGDAIDLFSMLGAPPPSELLMDDGLHFALAGQKRIAVEVVRRWSRS